MHAPEGHTGSHTGMFDFHMNKDISVLVGCGLGGTSLINANVSLRASPASSTIRAGPNRCVPMA